MAHPLVVQLRFTRAEWERGLAGVTAEDAQRRLGSMNSIGWMIGHLAWQEQRHWVQIAQGRTVAPELDALANGEPASTPPLDRMWAAWREVTRAADAYLDGLGTADLLVHVPWQGQPMRESVGTRLRRNTYHYWYHLGEALAVRQMLGQTELPQFVGDMTSAAYGPEN